MGIHLCRLTASHFPTGYGIAIYFYGLLLCKAWYEGWAIRDQGNPANFDVISITGTSVHPFTKKPQYNHREQGYPLTRGIFFGCSRKLTLTSLNSSTISFASAKLRSPQRSTQNYRYRGCKSLIFSTRTYKV